MAMNLKKMKVSVITVCYNSAATLEQTIQSVVGQSYDDIEYIIIDGGSTDGTLDIIRKYENQIAYWVSESDNGIYDAMNKGIRLATGDIIGFINSDDWYDYNAIEAVINKYIEVDADIVYGGLTFISSRVNRYESYDNVDLNDFYVEMKVAHPATFIKLDILKSKMFDTDYKIAADYKLLLLLYHNGYKFTHLSKNIAFFRLSGMSSRYIYKTARETKQISLQMIAGNRKFIKYEKKICQKYRKDFMFALLQFLQRRLSKSIKEGNTPLILSLEIPCYTIFGTGEVGQLCYQCLTNIGLVPSGFIDNDRRKWGDNIEGIPIKKFNKEANVDYGKILVATNKYNEDVCKQLEHSGLKNRIDYFSFYDWVEMLARWYGKKYKFR